MHHNNRVTRKFCTYSYTNASITCNAVQAAIQRKQLPNLFELFVKHNSNTFVDYSRT